MATSTVIAALGPDWLSILNSGVGMACGAAITGVAVWLFQRFKKSAGLPQKVELHQDLLMLMLRGMDTQDASLMASLESNKGIMEVLKAIALSTNDEAIRDTIEANKHHCNGNVDAATNRLEESMKQRKRFFEKLAVMGLQRTRLMEGMSDGNSTEG